MAKLLADLPAETRRISNRDRVHLVLVALALILGVAGFVAGYYQHGLEIQTRTIHTSNAPKTGAALVSAWGTPDQSVPGSQVNTNMAGLTCDVYQSRQAIVCH